MIPIAIIIKGEKKSMIHAKVRIAIIFIGSIFLAQSSPSQKIMIAR
jgi:hypothetical protein